jgi:hypothetical protein
MISSGNGSAQGRHLPSKLATASVGIARAITIKTL